MIEYKWLCIVAIFIILSVQVFADYTCIDENTSYFSTDMNISGAMTSINYNDTCKFGCSGATGECNPSPYDVSTTIFLIMPIISFFMLYFTSLLKEEDWMIHLLLMGAALTFLTIPLGTFSTILSGPYLGAYQFMLVISFVVIFYYILKVLVRAYQALGVKKK